MARSIHAGQKRSPRLYDIYGLTEGEMDLLICVLSLITGSASGSPRKYSRRLLKQLVKASGYYSLKTDAFELAKGQIHFRDYGSQPESSDPQTPEYIQRWGIDDVELPYTEVPNLHVGIVAGPEPGGSDRIPFNPFKTREDHGLPYIPGVASLTITPAPRRVKRFFRKG